MPLALGTKLGSYEVLSPLGAGGMGEVYRAKDTKLRREVAIKVLPESLANDADALSRFEREALAVAALSHPNILSIFDFGSQDGIAYAVMELLEGETMRARLDAGPIPRKQAVDFAVQIAKGLSAAHEKGIVHRDLKPENLFVMRDGHLKILDFGLAKRTGPARSEDETSAPTTSGRTESGTVLGTLGYMSPEQVRGLAVDARSDLFSFGAVLYELLSGKKAFKKDTASDTMVAILKEQPPEPSDSGRSIPPALDHIVKHCLEKSREDRFQSAKDILFALTEASSPSVADGTREVPAPSVSSQRNLILVAAGALALLGVGAAILLSRRPAAIAPSTAAGPSIAVLPFTNLSDDRNQEYFSDGLSEELRGLLTKVMGLHVAGRASSFAFKGKTEDLASIGQKLHVATVLEGSVRRAGEQLRVSTQLVNIADGYQIWAETYDRKLTDVFKVQDEIAAAVVAALKVRLLPQERPAASGHRTSNTEAYNQYLLGRQFFSRNNEEGFHRAVEAYQKAIALDPGYAAAHAGLAAAEFQLASDPRSADGQKALAAADRAISLDPELSEAYAARGYLRTLTWDWTGAQADLERAVVLDPADGDAHRRYGILLTVLGRMPEAIAAMRKAVEVDPLFAPAWERLGRTLNAAGQTPEARKFFARALEISPEDEYAHLHFGVAWLLEGNAKAALPEFERAGVYRRLTGLAMAEHDLGHARESQEALDALIATYAKEAAYRIAEVHAWRGEKDKAFEWLDRAYAQGDSDLYALAFDPLLAKLRGDARYPVMLKKMNLPSGK